MGQGLAHGGSRDSLITVIAARAAEGRARDTISVARFDPSEGHAVFLHCGRPECRVHARTGLAAESELEIAV